ncbi:MAG: ROK family protein [Anaerolineales bacterium]|nr:ROK family protein [Anaerolineales bacterium]
MLPVIAVDFGGTHIRAAYYPSDEPQPAEQIKVKTHAEEGPQSVLNRIASAIESVVPQDPTDLRIGIASPGPLDPYRGVILSTPNLPGWDHVPIVEDMVERFGCPVVLNNDANCAALGEWRHGAGKGVEHLIYLTISTGIGGGVITHGQLLMGARGLAAELGHMTVVPNGSRCGCGQYGHIESIASGPSVVRSVRKRLDAGEPSILNEIIPSLDELDAEVISRAAYAGDSLSRSAIQFAGAAIGSHLASLVHAFDPERIIIGGGFSQVGDLLFTPMLERLQAEVLDKAYLENLQLIPAELGDDAGLIGAMTLARQL